MRFQDDFFRLIKEKGPVRHRVGRTGRYWDSKLSLLRVKGPSLLKTWWCSVLLLPFVLLSVHQIYKALSVNIFFLIHYDYIFPYSIVYFLIFHFDLIVHEAGHTFFGIFGNRILYILGGSVYQVFLPFLIFAFAWFNRYWVGMQLSLAYLGFSWMSVAGYAGDAATRQLPLIGNLGKEAHDWHNIFRHLGVLESYMTFAVIFAVIGGLCYMAALALPAFRDDTEFADLDIDL